MSRLDKLPHIVDEHLGEIKMSDALKERIRNGIAQAEAQGQAPAETPSPRRRISRRWWLAGGGLVAACLLLAAIYVPFATPGGPVVPTEPEQAGPVITAPSLHLTVKAEAETAGGVDVATAFVIQADGPVDADTLRAGLAIEPAIDYTVTQRAEGEFVLQPEQPLDAGTVYKIALTGLAGSEGGGESQPLSWAFQTAGANRVVSAFPTDGASWVNTDSGIEIAFARTVQEAEGYVTLSPALKGHFEYRGKVISFVPEGGLAADTLYTVTVKAGLVAATGEVLEDDYTFAFRTADVRRYERPVYSLRGSLGESFLPTDPVVIALDRYYSGSAQLADPVFDANLYALSGQQYEALAREHAQSAHPTLSRATDYVLATDGLESVMAFETPLSQYGNDIGGAGLVLPHNPGAGYYLLDLQALEPEKVATPRLQKLICVSELSVWMQSLNGQTLLWVNDTASGLPLEGAQVTAGDALAVTDAQGLAVLTTAEQMGGVAMTVAAPDGREWRDRLAVTSAQDAPANRQYMSCIYFDRAAYLPTDTIRYWGHVSSRDGSGALPDGLVLELDYLPDQAVSLDQNGMFYGSITYENLISTYLTLNLRLGEDSLTACWLQIMDYVKPAYVLPVTFDKPYYRRGEALEATVSASFFEGTPATGLELSIEGSSYVTDAQGQVRYSRAFADWPVYGGAWPMQDYVDVYASGQEAGYAYGGGHVMQFISDYLPDVRLEDAPNGNATLRLDGYAVDFEAMDAWAAQHKGELYYTDEMAEAIRGQPYVQDAVVTLYKVEYVPSPAGEYYDFVEKVVRQRYVYQRVETAVRTLTVAGGQAATLLTAQERQSNPGLTYWVSVEYTTPDGAFISQRLDLGTRYGAYIENGRRTLWLSAQTHQFAAGQPLTLTLNDSTTPTPTGRMLYTVMQDDMVRWDITEDTELAVQCDAGLIPGFRVMGAYFDGQHIYSVQPIYLYYDYSERQLDITVTPDKAAYGPGDTVSAEVSVTYADGSPASADFVLSVVDEAAFAVAEQYGSVLGQLYAEYYYPMPVTHASYVQHDLGGDGFAEGGGEGDAGGARQDFLDTAAFVTGRTGQDGRASVTFDLPDNLTRWRMTCAAVSDDRHAGQSRAFVTAAQPFFTNVVMSDTYLVGDQVVMSSRCAGTALLGGETVRYTATLSGDSSGSLTVEAAAGAYAYFDFGKLPQGSYQVRIEARCGQLGDTVIYTFEVVPSRIEIPVSQTLAPEDIGSVKAQRYPVAVTFYDKALDTYVSGLEQLAAGTSQRADSRLAAHGAQTLLEQLGITEGCYAEPDLSGIQDYTGGVRLLQHAEPQAALTARALATVPQGIQAEQAIASLYRVIYDFHADALSVANAYMGLSAAQEPILLDIRALLAQPTYDLECGLSLAWGLCNLGDRAGAHQWYTEHVAPDVVAYGQDALRLEGQDLGTTALAAALAAGAGHPDAQGLIRYVLSQPEWGAYTLELLYALEASKPQGGSIGGTVELGGQSLIIQLTAQQPTYHMLMTQAELESAQPRLNPGAVARVSYIGGSEVLENTLDGATITRSYSFVSASVAKVSLNITLPSDPDCTVSAWERGLYTLTDSLPTGLRFLRVSDSDYDSGWYLSGEESGRVTFGLSTHRGGEEARRQSFGITYYARVSLPGEYVADSVVLCHEATGKMASLPPETLAIP